VRGADPNIGSHGAGTAPLPPHTRG